MRFSPVFLLRRVCCHTCLGLVDAFLMKDYYDYVCITQVMVGYFQGYQAVLAKVQVSYDDA